MTEFIMGFFLGMLEMSFIMLLAKKLLREATE